MILFSYHPLLRGPAGAVASVDRQNINQLTSILDDLPAGDARGCIWGFDEQGNPCIVFVFEQGEEIADHFKEWAEGDPESWFDLQLAHSSGTYALALVPDIGKSCDRQLAAMALAAGRAVPAPDQYSVLFRPLYFVSQGPSEMFLNIQDKLQERVKVGIVDLEDVPGPRVVNLDSEKIHDLGNFKLVRDASYIESLLKQRLDEI